MDEIDAQAEGCDLVYHGSVEGGQPQEGQQEEGGQEDVQRRDQGAYFPIH